MLLSPRLPSYINTPFPHKMYHSNITMAMHSRRSTDQLLLQLSDHPSSERTVIWPEKPKHAGGMVPVVYYLSRNGQLDHPHFIQVPMSSTDGLFLKDVLNKLNLVRGNGMPYLYSWSSKRGYKNGYVWQDLAEDDLIQPTNDHDYILKGSELLQPSTAVYEPHDDSSSGHRSGNGKLRKKNQSWSNFDQDHPANILSSKDNNSAPHECRVVRKCESSREFRGAKAWADMATQTESSAAERRRSDCTRKEVHGNKSEELSREDLSPPSMSSSEGLGSGLDGGIGSGDVEGCSSVLNPTVQNECTSGGRIKPSRVLMHWITCGSTDTVPLKKRNVRSH